MATTISGTVLGMTQVCNSLFLFLVITESDSHVLNCLGFNIQVLLVTGLNRLLGISDEWFAMGDSLILTVLAQVNCLIQSLFAVFFYLCNLSQEKRFKYISHFHQELPQRHWDLGQWNIGALECSYLSFISRLAGLFNLFLS